MGPVRLRRAVAEGDRSKRLIMNALSNMFTLRDISLDCKRIESAKFTLMNSGLLQ